MGSETNFFSSINSKDEKGMTQLHYAAENGDFEKAKLLIEKGADVNAKIKNSFFLWRLYTSALCIRKRTF